MKNKYLILILLFSIFAQAQDSTQVVLSTEVAREVVKDLTKGDFCEKELKETNKLVNQLETKIQIQEKEIKNGDEQMKLSTKLVDSKDEQITILKDSLRSEKNKKLGGKILLYLSLAANLFLIMKL